VGRRSQRATVDLGQAEERVITGDHDVGVPREADPTAHAEALHCGDQRHRAVVHGRERREATLVGADEGSEALGVLHLLDVDAGVEALALAAQDDDPGCGILARGGHRVGQLEPAGHRECVHRRDVDDDLRDPLRVALGADPHGRGAYRRPDDASDSSYSAETSR
jgi:hypothetical protein